MRRSSEISALNVREERAWKVIDYHLRLDTDTKVNAKVRQAAAEFVLKRIYPEKHIHQGDKENPIQIQVFIPKVEDDDESYGRYFNAYLAASQRPSRVVPSESGV